MRLAAYAGASTALASAVVIRALTERPNFYSAAVYLGQSNACNLILMNFLLLSCGSTVFGLQRLLYGPLRPIEIEQLWDKGWYAVTETALVMTTFRDEVDGWFFILFMALLAGKVWGWIGEGRVEILEQQPPANPRLFHTRLTASLILSEVFDILMLQYCINTLQEQPRPGMMVMFAFEFAVLFVSSTSTLARYLISVYEIQVEKQQKKIRVEERREELRAARQTADATNAAQAEANNVQEPEVDEDDLDVPGWQEKGRFVLFLDLATDFLKLILYAAFFAVLIIFSGIPIHMFRDLFITLRSFLKRINDFLKYRNATKDMNSRYPDATAQDLERDNTCIICREDMNVWQQRDANAPQSRNPPDERQRAKKLPCGHILHVGCLRSWLERQQVCPVCRASVLAPPAPRRAEPANQNPAAPGNPPGQAQPDNAQPGQQQPRDVNPGHVPGHPRRANFRARTFGFGNFRMTLGVGNHAGPGPNGPGGANANTLEQAVDRYRRAMEDARTNLAPGAERTHARTAGHGVQAQLASIERRITDDINSLHNVQHQLSAVRALQGQLEQLRAVNDHPPPPGVASTVLAQAGNVSQAPVSNPSNLTPRIGSVHRPLSPGAGQVLAAGDPQLPQGLSLPQGWGLMPLRRPGGGSSPSTAVEQTPVLGVEDLIDQVQPTEQQTQAAVPAAASSSPSILSARSSGPTAAENGASGAATTETNNGQEASPSSTLSQQTVEQSTSHTIPLPNWGSAGAASPSEPGEYSSAPISTPSVGPSTGQQTSETSAELSTNPTNGANGSVETGQATGKAATVEDAATDETEDEKESTLANGHDKTA